MRFAGIVIIGLWCAAPDTRVSTAAAATAGLVLTKVDLQAAVARYQRSGGDQFTPKPTQEDIIGRRFRTVTHFPQLEDAGGPRVGRIGGWTYDAGEGVLTLDPWIDMIVGYELSSDPSLHGGDNTFHGFVISAQGHYVGQMTKGNAMGATIKVDEYLGTALAVVAYKSRLLEHVFPERSMDEPPTKVPLAPIAAGDVTPHLVLVVEGEVAAYKGSRAIACGDTGSIATFERPSERTLQECVISAKIERYAIEDERTGKSLAEWRP